MAIVIVAIGMGAIECVALGRRVVAALVIV
ncbi:hypothetical protein JOE57_002286 [Microlunatus panaciterrae]|uniref:Uncharacterized protein n=1 Tax=Microlunatus panaciterrae TaxID=400768 RepID=A0ABS2RK29_9ACTN|nr:hypothetical protein [Microlunatus panaciterrae]